MHAHVHVHALHVGARTFPFAFGRRDALCRVCSLTSDHAIDNAAFVQRTPSSAHRACLAVSPRPLPLRLSCPPPSALRARAIARRARVDALSVVRVGQMKGDTSTRSLVAPDASTGRTHDLAHARLSL